MGWHDFTDVRVQPRSQFRNVSTERVDVVVSEESYPQLASEGTGARGHSWLTSLHPDASHSGTSDSISALNLEWKTPCGPGHGAPVVFRDLIMLVNGDEKGVDLTAYQLATGEYAWRRSLSSSAVQAKHPKGAASTSTPLVVGDRVIVCWSDMQQVWMASFDREGKEVWRSRVGETNSQWGFNSSPAPHRGLVFINVDNQYAGFVSAYNVANGKLVWRQTRPDGVEGSYSSPLVIADSTGEAIVVIAGLKALTALDAKSGNALWILSTVSDVSAATPVLSGSFLVASSGYKDYRLSVSEFEGGIFTKPRERWARNKPSEVPYVPTPLLSASHLFAIQDDGIAQCYELSSGKLIWKKRLGTSITASPMWLNGSILVCGESGVLLLVDPGTGQTTASLSLASPVFASPSLSGERLLVRTRNDLNCFQKVAGPQELDDDTRVGRQ